MFVLIDKSLILPFCVGLCELMSSGLLGVHCGAINKVASIIVAGTMDLLFSKVIALVLKSCFIPFSLDE